MLINKLHNSSSKIKIVRQTSWPYFILLIVNKHIKCSQRLMLNAFEVFPYFSI